MSLANAKLKVYSLGVTDAEFPETAPLDVILDMSYRSEYQKLLALLNWWPSETLPPELEDAVENISAARAVKTAVRLRPEKGLFVKRSRKGSIDTQYSLQQPAGLADVLADMDRYPRALIAQYRRLSRGPQP